MKLQLKAYKATFPSLLDYDREMWEDPLQYEVIYGTNQKNAVVNYCKNSEWHYFELKSAIRTRRYKEADLYMQEPSPLLERLSSLEINHLIHSLGVQIGDVWKGSFYRNYSVYRSRNKDFDNLIKLGLVENYQKFQDQVYSVTEKGKEAIKTLLLCSKKSI